MKYIFLLLIAAVVIILIFLIIRKRKKVLFFLKGLDPRAGEAPPEEKEIAIGAKKGQGENISGEIQEISKNKNYQKKEKSEENAKSVNKKATEREIIKLKQANKPSSGSGSGFEIKNEQDLLKNVEDKKLKEILSFLGEKNAFVFKEINKSFKDKKELEEFLTEKVMDYLNSLLISYKEKISKIRKKGVPMKIPEMQTFMITSKIKMFKATMAKKDLDKIFEIFNQIDSHISKTIEEKKINLEE
jgi:hypothetical protein